MSPVFGKILGEVPIWEVAKIAAMLLREGTSLSSEAAVKGGHEKDRRVAATAAAFELLEIASYGQRGLIEADSYAAGLAEFLLSTAIKGRDKEDLKKFESMVSDDAKFRSAVASLPKWEPEYDADGRPRPVPFDEGLAMLIPMRGESASKATDQRMVRFGEWLSDYYSEYEPDAEKRLVFVGNMIAEMKQKGISPQLFTVAGLQFLGWWEARKRGKNSDAGKKGQAKQTKATEPRISPKKRK